MNDPIRTSAVSVADGLVARDALREIADRWVSLRARLVPMTTGDGQGVRTAPTSRPPIDLHISDLMFEIEEEARQLGHVLMDETEWTPRTSAMPHLLREIADHYGHWIASDDRTALAFMDWAEDYRHRVIKALERPPSPEFIGLCPVIECSGDVYAKRGAPLGKCRSCGQPVEVNERKDLIRELSREWLLRQKDLPAALALHDYDVSIGTIKSWVHRKRLLPRGGRYKVEDALTLVENTRQAMLA